MDKKEFVKLCSRRWSIKALALINGGCTARVSPLADAAGCGRTAMADSINNLIALNLLERNPGYGHPLRPEFRLTQRGTRAAHWSEELIKQAAQPEDQAVIQGKWSLPVMSCLSDHSRFNQLKDELAPITDRSLSLSLNQLQTANWIERRVIAEQYPPLVHYQATKFGHAIRAQIPF